jgi:hypothetical protein
MLKVGDGSAARYEANLLNLSSKETNGYEKYIIRLALIGMEM